MNLNKKIISSVLWSIVFITSINIVGFYVSYNVFLWDYLINKDKSKKEVTLDYINKIIEKQALDEVDNVFNDIEVEFFELVEKNNWKINLNDEENVNIISNYLSKAWVSIKYIEEIIPKNYYQKLLANIKDKKSPEYIFLANIVFFMIVVNIFWISILILFLYLASKRIISPITKTAETIKNIKIWKDFEMINYNKDDEIWSLVNAINWLNSKLQMQQEIRTKMLWDISHELKTPITSIQCYMEWIKDNIIKLDDKTLNSILYEMQRLIKLVNLIMAHEQFENTKSNIRLVDLDVKFTTESVINQFRQRLKLNNQKIITLWNEKILKTDKDFYIQIIQNIISNFIKYAWENTLLKIEFWTNFIKFSDNWKWIKSSEIPYITEKYYQWKNKKVWELEDRWIWVWFSVINKLISDLNWEFEINSDENKWFEIKILTKTSH